MRIYISGPITGTSDYLLRFEAAEKLLKKRFPLAEIINPAEVCRSLPESFSHADYMDICLTLLKKCEKLYLMNGWQRSEGCREEWAFFMNPRREIEHTGADIIKETELRTLQEIFCDDYCRFPREGEDFDPDSACYTCPLDQLEVRR